MAEPVRSAMLVWVEDYAKVSGDDKGGTTAANQYRARQERPSEYGTGRIGEGELVRPRRKKIGLECNNGRHGSAIHLSGFAFPGA